MTSTEALQTIGAPIIETLSANWRSAWNDIRGPFNHPDHSSFVRSVLLREHAAIHGRRTLPEFGVQHFKDETQDMFVLPDDKACIIFKKLSEGRLASKNDTRRCQRLFQSRLIPDLPTLIVGLLPDVNWTDIVGIYICRPNLNGIGNSWALNITDGSMPMDADADQVNFDSQLEQTEFDDTKQQKHPKKPKFKPKYDKDIGESSEEAGSGGSKP